LQIVESEPNGLPSWNDNVNIQIFPTIVENKMRIQILNTGLYSLDGKKEHTQKIELLINNAININLPSISEGMYLLKITNNFGENIYRNKIIKK
jgi:hypothetical protein